MDEQASSRFSEVWQAVASDPYDTLPEERITPSKVLSLSTLKKIHTSARRTLSTRRDLLPYFDKLVHPIGICLRGVWRITEPTPYTGYFRQGSVGLLIARASVNMGETRPGRRRFLGLAGKLYPTWDPNHQSPLRTANFLMNENVLGSHTKYFAHATLSTDLLPFHFEGAIGIKNVLGALVAGVFAMAEKTPGLPHPLMRQLYPIAELGEARSREARAPKVMLLAGAAENRRVETSDLRKELDMRGHPEGVRFEVHVADERSYLRRHGLHRIGEVHFTESVSSCSCDHRLHFPHPPHRPQKHAPASEAPRRNLPDAEVRDLQTNGP